MRKKLLVEGMSCGHCVNHLKTALIEDIEGIDVIEVSLEDKCAVVEIKETVKEEEIKSLIEELGFELKGIE